MAYMRLGDLLIAAGAITQEQLEEALTIQKQTERASRRCSDRK